MPKLLRAYEMWQLDSGTIIKNVHPESQCLGRGWCSIHSSSDHHMVDWPQDWVNGRMMRECPHGTLHGDPDDEMFVGRPTYHTCDGCCNNSTGTTWPVTN